MNHKNCLFLNKLLFAIGIIVCYFTNVLCEMRPSYSLSPIKDADTIMVEEMMYENFIDIDYYLPVAIITNIDSGYRCDTSSGLCYRTIVRIGNAEIYSKSGEPIIPVMPIKVIIPSGKEIDYINVERGGIVEFIGDYLIEFGENFTYNDTVVLAEPDISIYNSDNPYPLNSYVFRTVQEKCGVSIACIDLFPLSYFPLSGKIISYSSINLDIFLKNDTSEPTYDLPVRTERVNPALLGIENPEALETYVCTSPPEICYPPERYGWIFITSQAMIDYDNNNTKIQELKIFREEENGLTTKIETIDDILTNSLYNNSDHTPGQPAEDDAVKLRNFIKYAYENWDAKYIVLAGDDNVLPIREYYMEIDQPDPHEDIKEHIVTDLYFQCLKGPCNGNGNSKWGEKNDGEGGGDIDLLPEVYIGRICAGATFKEELEFAIEKILDKHEKSPDYDERLTRPLMWGENLDYFPGTWGAWYMEEIRLGSNANGYQTKGFVQHPNYFTTNDGTKYDGHNPWTRGTVKNALENGTYSIFNHLGHANHEEVMKCDRDYVRDDIKNSKPVFLYTQGCLAGQIDKNCIAEYMTTSTEYAMFGGVFNSHVGFYQPGGTNGASQYLDRYFWHAYLEEEIYLLGEMNAYSHEKAVLNITGMEEYVRWVTFTTNLFCDPYTPIREFIPVTREKTSPAQTISYKYFELGGKMKAHDYIKISGTANITTKKDLKFIAGNRIEIGQFSADNGCFTVPEGVNFEAYIDPELELSE